MTPAAGEHVRDVERHCRACGRVTPHVYGGTSVDGGGACMHEAHYYTCTALACGTTTLVEGARRPDLHAADVGRVLERRR